MCVTAVKIKQLFIDDFPLPLMMRPHRLEWLSVMTLIICSDLCMLQVSAHHVTPFPLSVRLIEAW